MARSPRQMYSIAEEGSLEGFLFPTRNTEPYVEMLESANGTVEIDGKEYRTPIIDPEFDATSPLNNEKLNLGARDGRIYISVLAGVDLEDNGNPDESLDYRIETLPLSKELSLKLARNSEVLVGMSNSDIQEIGLTCSSDDVSDPAEEHLDERPYKIITEAEYRCLPKSKKAAYLEQRTAELAELEAKS
jgi:hypothetical protein